MNRDHLLGSPALAGFVAGEHARPARVASAPARLSLAEQAVRRTLDTSRLKPGKTRLRMAFPSATNHGRTGTVTSLLGSPECPLVLMHFDGDALPDPARYVASVFELAAAQ